jgi:hypothetical protein
VAVEQNLINQTFKCSCDACLSDLAIRMHIELMLLVSFFVELMLLVSLFVALAIMIKLTGRLQRSWVERDLCVGDLRALSNIASGRSFDGPDLDQVERLGKRGFLTTTARGTCRMTLTGYVAILLRNTSARSKLADERARKGRAAV